MKDIDTRIEAQKQQAIEALLTSAVLRCETKLLSMLCRLDKACANVAPIVEHHCPKDVREPFRASWNELRHMIQKIERKWEDAE